MDNKIFEDILHSMSETKVDTEYFLTMYYKGQGNNVFKSAEYAQGNISNFLSFANDSVKESAHRNVASVFISATKDIVELNADYLSIKAIQDRLLEMNWLDFEFLSSTLLENCFGATGVKTTQSSGDGGVDFEGKIQIKTINSNGVYGAIEVYGQSKKYAGNVGIYDIKSFVAFANSKKRNYVHPPQLFMFFTTSDYCKNALEELRENGFIGLSGSQIAQLIFSHRLILREKSDILRFQVLDKLD